MLTSFLLPSSGMMPYAFDDAELQGLRESADIVTLIIASDENVTDPSKASDRARAAGIDVVRVDDAGHLMVMEKPEVLAGHLERLLLL